LRNCSVLAIRPADSQSLKKLSKLFSCHLCIIACRPGLNSMPASISGSFSVGDLLANFESKTMVATVQD
jgi:Fe-S-cluster-containing hydrogenase component 2